LATSVAIVNWLNSYCISSNALYAEAIEGQFDESVRLDGALSVFGGFSVSEMTSARTPFWQGISNHLADM
jgi:hypothetical protein